MTTRRRRRFTADFKKRVALEALRGDRTVQHMALRPRPASESSRGASRCCRGAGVRARRRIAVGRKPGYGWRTPGAGRVGRRGRGGSGIRADSYRLGFGIRGSAGRYRRARRDR